MKVSLTSLFIAIGMLYFTVSEIGATGSLMAGIRMFFIISGALVLGFSEGLKAKVEQSKPSEPA